MKQLTLISASLSLSAGRGGVEVAQRSEISPDGISHGKKRTAGMALCFSVLDCCFLKFRNPFRTAGDYKPLDKIELFLRV